MLIDRSIRWLTGGPGRDDSFRGRQVEKKTMKGLKNRFKSTWGGKKLKTINNKSIFSPIVNLTLTLLVKENRLD
jgi:hypothetical protein